MKRVLILLICFLSPYLMKGQVIKVFIGHALSYDLYDWKLKPSPDDMAFKKKSTYSIGFTLQYNPANYLVLKTGLLYSIKGLKIIHTGAEDTTKQLIPILTTFNASYIDIPLLAGIRIFGRKKLVLAPSGGLELGVLAGRNEITNYKDKTTRFSTHFNSDLNSLLLSFQINMAVEYHLDNKLCLILEPYYNKGLNKIDNNIMHSNPVSYGAQLSINYKLSHFP